MPRTRLLAPVDIHDRGEDVVDLAVPWAQRLDAELDLLYVEGMAASEVFITDPSIRRLFRQEVEALHKTERASLDELMGRIPEENRGTAHLISGRPADPQGRRSVPSHDPLSCRRR